MTAVRHFEGDEVLRDPAWADVEAAVRRMENFSFPCVELNTSDDYPSPDMLVVVGGEGRWALAQNTIGGWAYEDPAGSDEEVRLWESDQGYFCEAKNIVTDIEKVLRIVRAYYDTGSYDGLDAVK